MRGDEVVYRPYHDADASDIARFFAESSSREAGTEPVSEASWKYFASRDFNHAAKDFAVATSADRMVGLLTSTTKADPVIGLVRQLRVFTHPEYRRQGIGTKLLEIADNQGLAEVAQQGNIVGKWAAGIAFAQQFGFSEVHRELLMKSTQAVTPVSPQAGVRLREYRMGDEWRWAELSNEAYRDGFNFVAVTPESLANDATFDGLNLWIAEKDDEIIGFCDTVIESQAGILNSLVVDPKHRGQGIGRLLLLQAMTTLRARGQSVIELNVDSTNPTAIALYRSVGFEEYDTMSLYRRQKTPGAKQPRELI